MGGLSTRMEKIDQAMTVLTLTMGLCLMWEGYTDLSEAPKTAVRLSGFDISSTTASGGNPIQATLTFSDLTPMNGAVVKMTSTDPSTVSVSDIPVPAARKSWQLSIPTNSVNTAESVTITASYGGIALSVVVTVQQLSHRRCKRQQSRGPSWRTLQRAVASFSSPSSDERQAVG
jgi:hypothetical protein